MSHPVIVPKKLIEVALPLDAINEASAKEKSIRHGHPSTLHLYWARRPLAAARAVIFSQMVNDPSWRWEIEHPGETPSPQQRSAWTKARRKLFELIEILVQWENTNDEDVLAAARAEIRKSWRETCEVNRDHPDSAILFDPEVLPGFHDPFAGGGALPLEAQRLGLESYASDLNPVAVLLNRAMIEIPARFSGRPPVSPDTAEKTALIAREWKNAQGLAEDVRCYGAWMRDEAERRIGEMYPKIRVTASMAKSRPDLKSYVGQDLTVIAWLWARTVKSPNPAFAGIDVPLASSFILSTKEGKAAYVEPVLEADGFRFQVRIGVPDDPDRAKRGTKLSRGANFECLMSGTPISSDYIYAEATAGRMGSRLMAIVAEGTRGRVYLSPTEDHEQAFSQSASAWKPELAMPDNPRWFSPPLYGLKTYGDLFTPRQLLSLTTFSDLVGEAIRKVEIDAIAAGLPPDQTSLREGGTGAKAYAEAVGLYLGLGVSRLADAQNSLCQWGPAMGQTQHMFRRQAIPMVWDYSESNVFAGAAGDLVTTLTTSARVLEQFGGHSRGYSIHGDAQTQSVSSGKVVSTDPPYYDNIGYADLSDFFYVWLRRSLRDVFPDLFATISVPKSEELVATPYRHGGKQAAEAFFLDGMTKAMHRLAERAHPSFPVTIYYAFKQAENESELGVASTGWETFLGAVMQAGFSITGTWPIRTERTQGLKGSTNALASSVVLVCRKRAATAPVASRREFARALSRVIPQALQDMTTGANGWGSPVAPVDLSQAIIGPGMGLFTQYSSVIEADGRPMSVRTALQLINRYLADDDFDADTRFCLAWFEQYGFAAGPYGDAETLAKAKGTSVEGVKASGVLTAGAGRVQLTKWTDYPTDWDPTTDSRIPVWEVVHHIIRALRQDGDSAAGRLAAQVLEKAGPSRQLAYRLFTICERAKRADEARAYNELITGWSGIEAVMSASATAPLPEPTLFDDPA